MDDLRLFLSPADYIDSDHPAVAARAPGPVESARRLYLFVRDAIRYDPYVDYTDPETFRASSVLKAQRGYCVGKASLYAALCRAAGIPARLGLDGRSDALLQAFDGEGRRFMTYEVEHGAFFDVPVKYVIAEMKRLYPRMCRPGGLKRDMEVEATAAA